MGNNSVSVLYPGLALDNLHDVALARGNLTGGAALAALGQRALDWIRLQCADWHIAGRGVILRLVADIEEFSRRRRCLPRDRVDIKCRRTKLLTVESVPIKKILI